MNAVNGAVVHIRFDGRSVDIWSLTWILTARRGGWRNQAGRRRLPGCMADKFKHYVVDRHKTGNLTIRPEAVFG